MVSAGLSRLPCRRRLDREPQRVPWYPGSDKRQAAFRQKFATAEAHGSDQAVRHEGVKAAPWLLQAGLSPDKVGSSVVKPRFCRLVHAGQTTCDLHLQRPLMLFRPQNCRDC